MMDTRPAICGQAAYLLDTPIPLDLIAKKSLRRWFTENAMISLN